MPRRLIALAALSALATLAPRAEASPHRLASVANQPPNANSPNANPPNANPPNANPSSANPPDPNPPSTNPPDANPPADPANANPPDDAPASAATTPAAEPATSQPAASTVAEPAADEADDGIGDQGISAEIGLATGGRSTPGGLRIVGRYSYQLSARDWFDGAASFTFGSSRAACFRDRDDLLVCDHGLADGAGVELIASVRRVFEPRGAFRPFARVGIGLGLARFGDDDVSGVTIPLHGGGGMRVKVAPAIAVVASADLALGFASFGSGLGGEPQLGFAITAGAEFRLR